jgi:hypothetical protein
MDPFDNGYCPYDKAATSPLMLPSVHDGSGEELTEMALVAPPDDFKSFIESLYELQTRGELCDVLVEVFYFLK